MSNQDLNLSSGTVPVLDLYAMYNGSLNIREELDRIVRDAGFGGMSTINYLTLRGFNYLRHGQQLVHGNRDHMGYTFFTRPILNLTYDNLSATDEMTVLRNAPPHSISAYVRGMLDPWSQMGKYDSKIKGNGSSLDKVASVNKSKSPMIDPSNPFIPILSNTLVSLTGWKDIAVNDYTSPTGVHNEQYGHADGFYYITNSFELSSSFRNIEGDPVSLLFQTWIHYYLACRNDNEMNPYPYFVEAREFDYFSRIYRFVMDGTKTYIQKYAATIGFPTSVPTGNTFNYSADKNFIDVNSEIPVTWKCFGQDVNKPVLFYEFNKLVELYDKDLAIDYSRYDEKNQSLVLKSNGIWRKLKPNEKNRGIGLAIPLVNYITYELEWWIRQSDWELYVKDRENPRQRRSYRPMFQTP